MLHPLLDKAGDGRRSPTEKEVESRNKDSEQEKKANPAEIEWPEDNMPLDEAADFRKDIINGMAQFQIDVERQYRIDKAKADSECQTEASCVTKTTVHVKVLEH